MGGPETAPSVLTPTPTTCAVKLEPVREDASGPAASVSMAVSLASAAGRLRAGGWEREGLITVTTTNARWCVVCLRMKVVSKELLLYFMASDNSQIIIQFFLPSQPLVQIKKVIIKFQKIIIIYRNCRFGGYFAIDFD